MVLGERIKEAMRARGMKQADLARAMGVSAPWVSEFLQKKSLHTDLVLRVAYVLGVDANALLAEDDETFLAALGHDPTTPDPEPPDEPTGRGGAGILRSYPIETFVHADAAVDGSIALDVIKRPTGRSGAALKKRHAQRGDRSAKTAYVELHGIPPGAEIVRAEAPIVLADEDRTIFAGDLLVVAREQTPEPGRLVIAKRDVKDWRAVPKDGEAWDVPEIRLMRFHPLPTGWALSPIDGSGRNVGPGDGWEIVAAVLWWRSPP